MAQVAPQQLVLTGTVEAKGSKTVALAHAPGRNSSGIPGLDPGVSPQNFPPVCFPVPKALDPSPWVSLVAPAIGLH